MNQHSSSISSSDPRAITPWRSALKVLAWLVASLVVIDVAINAIFAYPQDPKETNPSSLQKYFDYGRSTEGKLRRMTICDRDKTAPITLSGWYSPLTVLNYTVAKPYHTVSIYGMSHAMLLGSALERVSDRHNIRRIGAPGASANWAYGAYLRDTGNADSDVVVLAMMSLTIPVITSASPMFWNYDGPSPYTADRFELEDNKLVATPPDFDSFDDYCKTFMDKAAWEKAMANMTAGDTSFSEFAFNASWLDNSALFRLVRRAHNQHTADLSGSYSISKAGVVPDSKQIIIAQAIVREFASDARSKGKLPVIYIVNNLGYGDYLYQSLKPVLESDKIPFVNSATIADPALPMNYLSDSHFIPPIDDEIARELVRVVDAQARKQ
jgi:hypothetical protein